MILYHGSNTIIEQPKLIVQNRVLDFVSANRNRTYHGNSYELIYGPVANDDVFVTFALYAAGELSKEETLIRLKIKRLFNQLVFSSERALSFLKFIGVLEDKEGL